MTPRERLLTWSTLAALLVMMSSMLLRPAGVIAQDETKAPSLGPASSVELVEEDGKSIQLTAVDGRLSWGDEPQQQVQSVAYVHIGALLSPLMEVEERSEERRTLTERIQEDAQVLIDQLESIQSQIEGLNTAEGEGQELIQQGQQLAQQLQAFRQQAQSIQEGMMAQQIEQCYKEIVTGVNVVADRRDIDTVYRFIPTEDEFSIQDINSAMTQIRLRAVLRYPEQSDITEEVAEELNLVLE